MNDLERAKELLKTGGYTCVLVNGNRTYTSSERGISPMAGFLSNGTDLQDFSAADKIVGKAAAMLFILAGVKEVYATVMSKPAADVLSDHGVSSSCDTLTERVINRAGTGVCPMEQTVRDIHDPRAAFDAISQKLDAKILDTRL